MQELPLHTQRFLQRRRASLSGTSIRYLPSQFLKRVVFLLNADPVIAGRKHDLSMLLMPESRWLDQAKIFHFGFRALAKVDLITEEAVQMARCFSECQRVVFQSLERIEAVRLSRDPLHNDIPV